MVSLRAGFLALPLLAGCSEILGIESWSPGADGSGGAGGSATATAGMGGSTSATASVTSTSGTEATSSSGSAGGGGGFPCGPPAPSGEVTLACGEDRPSAIATDGTHLYFAANGDGGAIKRMPVGGGRVEILASSQGQPCGIAIDTTHVYWRTREGEVRRMPLGGGGPQPVASGQGDSCAIAVDPFTVYWANTGTATIVHAALDGSLVASLVGMAHPAAISARDATRIYWTDPWANAVYSVKKDGSSSQTQIGSGTNPCGLHVDSIGLAWSNQGAIGGTSGQMITSDLDAAAAPVILADMEPAPCGLALLGQHFYYLGQSPAAGQLRRVPRMPGAVELIVEGQDEPCAIAADTASVYWTTCAGGTVMRLTPD